MANEMHRGRDIYLLHVRYYYIWIYVLVRIIIIIFVSLTSREKCYARCVANHLTLLDFQHTMEEVCDERETRIMTRGKYVWLFITATGLAVNRKSSACRTAYLFQPTCLFSQPFCMSKTQDYIIPRWIRQRSRCANI